MCKKPNVLFIMDDQHRFDFVGFMGADFVNTPHLDRLAARGMVFNRCYTNSPLCVPARIALAAGIQPGRLGAIDNNCCLPSYIPTLYQRFRDQSYRVGHVGKLDLAKPDNYNGRYGDRPLNYQWGFTHPEECEGKMHAGQSPVPLGPYGFYLQEEGLYDSFYQDYQERAGNGYVLKCHDSVLPTEAFEDAYIGRRAAKWLDEVPDDFPWFYLVNFVGPHDPFDPPTEYADQYRNANMPAPIIGSMNNKPGWVNRRQVTTDVNKITETRRQYCAAIQLIDDQIGSILEVLERRGMMDNTYIIFTSDHGEMAGDHGLYQKSVAYEPAVHVPLIVSGPGIQAGTVSDALIELIDLHPTICDLSGIRYDSQTIDAQSFEPVLNGKAVEHRSEVLSCGQNFRSIRTSQYKLIHNINDIFELYNMEKDPHEENNLADQEPGICKELNVLLKKRLLQANS